MSNEKKIGEISEVNGKVALEWDIANFFSYTEEVEYISPDFHTLNLTWRIKIWPNGRISNNSVGHVSLYLHRVDHGASKSVDFSMGIKSKNQRIVNMCKTTWQSDDGGWGWPKFIEKSKLQQEKENLVPWGILTVVCSLILKDNEEEFDRNESKYEV